MRCPHCGNEIARVATVTKGNNVNVGDVIIGRALTVIKCNGAVEIKCSRCKNMVHLKRIPVFSIRVESKTGTINTE